MGVIVALLHPSGNTPAVQVEQVAYKIPGEFDLHMAIAQLSLSTENVWLISSVCLDQMLLIELMDFSTSTLVLCSRKVLL